MPIIPAFAAAVVTYSAFAAYLYQPHYEQLSGIQYLLVFNTWAASLGGFVLSRRWVAAFPASLFAGAMYGFGAFALGLACFHPAAGFLAAMLPWLFCPAAFVTKIGRSRLNWLLSCLPFLAIILFFGLSAQYGLFPVPINLKLRPIDLLGLPAPLVAISRSVNIVSFYHVPIAALIMGAAMLVAARRFGVMIIFAVAAALACYNPILGVSPFIWLAIPSLCCAVLIGVGMQGLAGTGSSDKKWLLTVAIIMASLSIAAMLAATKQFQAFAGPDAEDVKLFILTAKMYLLGAVAVAVVYFMVCVNLRVLWLRWLVICSAAAVDIVISARYIIDKIL